MSINHPLAYRRNWNMATLCSWQNCHEVCMHGSRLLCFTPSWRVWYNLQEYGTVCPHMSPGGGKSISSSAATPLSPHLSTQSFTEGSFPRQKAIIFICRLHSWKESPCIYPFRAEHTEGREESYIKNEQKQLWRVCNRTQWRGPRRHGGGGHMCRLRSNHLLRGPLSGGEGGLPFSVHTIRVMNGACKHS
jgi:hypothetical protein